MKLIAAVDEAWGIGAGGRLMVRIPDDLARFKALTWGQTVIMGKRTLATLPGGRPLRGRVNIVLSRGAALDAPGAIHARSLEEALLYAERERGREAFVVGGQSVYEQMLPCCAEALITRWSRGRRESADAFMPDLDALPQWTLADVSDARRCGDITYRYLLYRNNDVQPVP